MEWNTPEMKTFIDGRGDIFIPAGVYDDYLDVVTIQRPFEVFDKYNIAYALLYPKTPLTYAVDRSPQWRLIYSDNLAALYERVSGPGAPVGASADLTKSER